MGGDNECDGLISLRQRHILFLVKHIILIMLMVCVQDNSYIYVPKANVEYFSL